jgi:hypothetical protein
MHFKLIIALVEEGKTNAVLDAARQAGATGSTVINHARGEGIEASKTFFGLSLETQRDMLMFLADFDKKPGTGIAFQIDVEDAVGVAHQVEKLSQVVEEEI